MKRKAKKSKFLILFIVVLASLISILLYCRYIYEVKIAETESKNEIFEIKNTAGVHNLPNSTVIKIVKHYMITNPPDNLQTLKDMVKKFNDDKPIGMENQLDEKKDRHYEVYFYRESEFLPKLWQPDEGYFNKDRIDDHMSDCIAVIKWSDSDRQKSYDIFKRSSYSVGYGTIIEELH